MTRSRMYLWLMAVLFIMYGCAAPVEKCNTPEDSKEHHYVRGMEELEKENFDAALEKFERSKDCDQKYSPAYGGMAIATALQSVKQSDKDFKKAKEKTALQLLDLADKFKSSPEDVFAFNIAKIRVYTLLQTGGWLDKSKFAYEVAKKTGVNENRLEYYAGRESLDYFMGNAYFKALEFQQARDLYRAVLDAKRESKWQSPAEKMWKRVDKVVRAMAGITVGDVGKKIALKDEISRGDMAALLIDELKIDKLFAGRIPVQSQLDKMKAEFTPADVLNHHFKSEILTIMKWKIRGLEPQFDQTTQAYLFNPDAPVKRIEMAYVLEDVLVKLTNNERLSTAYFGSERSPFPDIKPTSAGFNAAMNMTTRGIMEGELSGEFRPDAPVTGAEALLGIRVLSQTINIH